MITILDSQLNESTLSPTLLLVLFVVFWAIAIAIYLLTGFGLRRMGLNRNLRYTKFAFVPALRWLLVCEIAGKVMFFRKEFKSAGIVMACVASLYFLCMLFIDSFTTIPVIAYAYKDPTLVSIQFKQINVVGSYNYGYFVTMLGNQPMFTETFTKVLNAISYVAEMLSIVYLVISLSIFSSFFKKYVPEKSLWFTLLCIAPTLFFSNLSVYGMTMGSFVYLFSIFGIITFCIKNKPEIDYQQFLASRYGFYGQRKYSADTNPFTNCQNENDDKVFEEDFEDKKSKDNSEPFDDFFNS